MQPCVYLWFKVEKLTTQVGLRMEYYKAGYSILIFVELQK